VIVLGVADVLDAHDQTPISFVLGVILGVRYPSKLLDAMMSATSYAQASELAQTELDRWPKYKWAPPTEIPPEKPS
jgi:hypothetical protein